MGPISGHTSTNFETMTSTSSTTTPASEDFQDGHSAHDLFVGLNRGSAYTYDDLILLPGHINFPVDQVLLDTRVSRNISLSMPLVSSPMDTVTEHLMAINMALHGGIGIIHYNMTVEEQAREVRLVKKFKNGFITDPICLAPTSTLADVDRIKSEYGFAGIPVTENSQVGSKLLGMVSSRDIDFVEDRTTPLAEVMTTDLITAEDGVSLSEANRILKESKKGKLPIINLETGELVSLISRRDLVKNRDFPFASKDQNKQLLVGAAIGTRPGDRVRCSALVEAGVNLIVIDSSQGDSTFQLELVTWIKGTKDSLNLVILRDHILFIFRYPKYVDIQILIFIDIYILNVLIFIYS